MASKVGLIFLVVLMAGISFGNGDSSETMKEPAIDVEVPENITELVNLITLKNTLTLWDEPKFYDCLEGESYHFFYTAVRFTQNLTTLIQKFNATTKDKNRRLADKIYEYVNENHKLMEKARIIITKAAKKPKHDVEKVKRDISPIAEKLILNFQGIDENLFKIQSKEKKLAKLLKNYKKNVEGIKNASKQLVEEIQRCLQKLNT